MAQGVVSHAQRQGTSAVLHTQHTHTTRASEQDGVSYTRTLNTLRTTREAQLPLDATTV
jgi:hypothetical protein